MTTPTSTCTELEATVIQCVAELSRGLDIADGETRLGRLADARNTLVWCNQILNVLDSAIPALCKETR